MLSFLKVTQFWELFYDILTIHDDIKKFLQNHRNIFREEASACYNSIPKKYKRHIRNDWLDANRHSHIREIFVEQLTRIKKIRLPKKRRNYIMYNYSPEVYIDLLTQMIINIYARTQPRKVYIDVDYTESSILLDINELEDSDVLVFLKQIKQKPESSNSSFENDEHSEFIIISQKPSNEKVRDVFFFFLKNTEIIILVTRKN